MSSQAFSWKKRFRYLSSRMFRTKTIDHQDMKTELRRCLSTFQLTFLGIGSTIGVGIYVLLGEVAKEQAGPAVIVCFILAILITLVNALVYAELSSRVPLTGASYTFFYKIFGEYPAFLSGWIMLVCYIMSSSIGARAWSGMLDSFFNNSIQAYTTSTLGKVQFGHPFAEHLDIVAFVFQITLTIIVTCNVQCSSFINTALGALTTSVLVFVCIAGLIFGDASNFVNADNGGFFPFGLSGVIKGTSLALYATSGFDMICISAEEAKDPGKSVPRAIVWELFFVALVYIGAAVGMLFLIPYWLLDLRSPLSSAMEYSGLIWGKYIVTVGPLFGITNLQMLGLYGCSRVMYRMASDNLFFSAFLKVNSRTGTPTNSVVLAGSLVSVFALLFDLSYLVGVTVLLMLISNLTLGSALIKLNVSESEKYLRLDSSQPLSLEGEEGGEDIEFDQPYKSEDAKEADGEMPLLSVYADVSADRKSQESIRDTSSKQGDSNRMAFSETETEIDKNVNQTFSANGNFKTGASQTVVEAGDGHGEEDLALCEISSDEQEETSSRCQSQKVRGSEAGTRSFRSLRARLWTCLIPDMPKLFSANVLIGLHWLSCVSLAYHIFYGWQDIAALRPVAVVALSFLVVSMLMTTFLIWLQRTKQVSNHFQTPLMPLVPTLSMTGSSVLMFSTLSVSGVLELIALIVIGSVMYFGMIWTDMRAQLAISRNEDQMRSLVDNVEDSEEEL